MLALPLIANVAVLTPLIALLLADAPRMTRVYGPDTAARRILTCLYATILIASAALLVALWADHPLATAWVQLLLTLQIVYKLGTVALVGLRNPVVLSNLVIALAYAAILALA